METPAAIKPEAKIEADAWGDCPLCGNRGEDLYHDLEDKLFSAPGRWRLRLCNAAGCGYVWMDPRPLPSHISIAYRQYYTHEDRDEFSIQTKGLGSLLKRTYAGSYHLLRMLFGIERDRENTNYMFLKGETPGRLLDVGCGGGAFLQAMQKIGWTVVGLDNDPKAVDYAKSKGLDVRLGSLEQFRDEPIGFDAITLSHVIEHVYNPWEFLDEWGALLTPGGRIILRTPNIRSSGAKLFGRYWRGLEPPRHLQLFSPQSIAACAKKMSLPLDRVWTTSAGAETIWIASLGLAMSRHQPHFVPTRRDVFLSKVLGPFFAIYAKIVFLFNSKSGDELCASFKKPVG